MKFLLIRHGKTQGNLDGRYIGCRTDEPLCPKGIEALRRRTFPAVDGVFASPMLRCVQTAQILFPGMEICTLPGLRECDFGDFENKNYIELSGDPAYQRWIDSGGALPFPGGESREAFIARCASAFREATCALPDGTYAFVVHGGTIMAIMQEMTGGAYYDFQPKNGRGYALFPDGRYEKI
ncbi:MAG: histidine phosphatase family protein [Clostridia bacterium]|nr:histidine phosphatase family protein [Clostridia bacterium]